ncbi:hypothetical protein CLV63_14112 [Murinocardiopsis flavida]|uniref:Uncharacterized protein n=1 Tax=Murinocardiopsis flavida TaxID=645275 RepID=A0A2P8CDM3_9ACTN|nr:hypothetical protein [Murinocardiopsis flavida]PSK83046.1 hypothetical protein CLV63_14112 [Murinocardiopsis flavida]
MPAEPTAFRCGCAAALARARDTYGHMAGHTVWVESTQASGSYRGILRILADRPGYLYLDRGDPDRSKTWHIDEIGALTPST